MLFSKNKFLKHLTIGLFPIILAGCAASDGGGNSDGGGTDGNTDTSISESTFNLITDSNGSTSTSFSVPSTATKFAVDATVEGRFIRFEQLQDSSGVNYLTPGGETITFASEFLADINNANVPSRNLDPNINTSRTFSAIVTVARTENGGIPISEANVIFKVHSRTDGNFNSGTLRVNLFYVGDIGQSAVGKSAVAAGLLEFRRIYANAGIALAVSEFDISGSNVIPNPLNGSSFYQSAAATANSPSVNIFIAGDVSGEENTILGIAGGLPAPAFPSTRSALVVSLLTGAGMDGNFDTVELRLLGESMAHESGHYLGLFHPVELTSGSVDGVDPLTDTPTCSTKNECVNNDSLAGNVMFTQPVLDPSGDYVPQNLLTSQQSAVLNRNIAVD